MKKFRKNIKPFILRFSLVLVFSASLVNLLPQKRNTKVPDYRHEKMHYNLKLGFFTIGEANVEFVTSMTCKGAKINAEAKSSGFVKIIKDVHYKFESCMDTLTGLPSVASRRIIEDDFSSLNTVEYFHKLRSDSSVVYSTQTDSLVVPKNIFDILTGFYHFRANGISNDLPKGHVDTVTTFFIDEVWDLIIRFAGEETIKTKYGMVKCLKFMPVTEVGRFFKTTDDMSIWVTKAGKNIPVRLEVDLKVGSLVADLESYQAPGKPSI